MRNKELGIRKLELRIKNRFVRNPVFKNDKYRKVRGGYSRHLKISCEKCGVFVCLYQKDGSGSLKRMYIDRITEPNVPLLRKDFSCRNGHLLGIKITYKKEKRSALRLFTEAVLKKIVKSS